MLELNYKTFTMVSLKYNPIKFLIYLITLILAESASLHAENIHYEEIASSDTILINYLKEHGVTTTHHNDVKLLKSGHEKFIDLFNEIEKAEHHIHLEYFNFRNDSIANTLFTLLEKKSKEGVKVRAIFDAFGNSSNNQPLKKKHLKELRSKGIDIVKFDPLKFPWINHAFHRDHRKIVIIDGKIGYTGGMNIADYYIKGLPEIGDWRDIHVRINGEAVSNLQDIFLSMWELCTEEKIEGGAYYPYKGDATVIDSLNKTIAIVDRFPKRTPKLMRRAYAKAIESAESKVQIINPYFTPTRIIKKAIKRATQKGVKVEIMIPGKSDIPFTPDAAFYIANRLRKKGADIYIYNGGFHHSKIMMVDSLYCTVGSTNLNSRSLRYDYEINAFIFDKATTEELICLFEEDQKDSTLLTSEIYKKRSLWKKFLGWFAHLFTPFI